jgi:antitoxin (DNA-binding transcriptional repressor) of toxin-antitoxin stability system
MTHQLTIAQAEGQLESLMAEAFKGDEVIITGADKREIKLVPIQKPVNGSTTRKGFGSLKGKVWMSDDFDAPLEDFAEYM